MKSSSNSSPFSGAILLLLLSFCTYGFLLRSGRLDLQIAPDSKDYLQYQVASLTDVLSSIRTPAYPLFLKLVSSTVGIELLPTIQWFLWILVVLIFYLALLSGGFRRATALVATAPMVLASAQVEFAAHVLADSMAVSLSVVAVGSCVAWGKEGTVRWLGLATFASLASILTRPAFLFLIPCLPLLTLVVNWLSNDSRTFRALLIQRGLPMLAATLLPFFTYCSLRYVVVNEFGLVSFAGHNIIGIAAQSLEPNDIHSLPDSVKTLARDILDRREVHPQYHPPKDYETMESNFNPMVWQIAVPAAKSIVGNDTLEVDRSLSILARSSMLRHPGFYIRWLIWNAKTAFRRTLEVLAHDLGIQLALVLFVGMAILSSLRFGGKSATLDDDWVLLKHQSRELFLLLWISILFWAMGMGLVILVEPSLTRYVQSVSVLLPPVVSCLLFHTAERWWSDRVPVPWGQSR